MNTDILAHEHWFEDFTQAYRRAESLDPGPIDLKIEHTRRVLAHARRIVATPPFATPAKGGGPDSAQPVVVSPDSASPVVISPDRVSPVVVSSDSDLPVVISPDSASPVVISPDSALLVRATLLAALFHDVGRFPQYAAWHTFKDSASVNHGLLGVKILKQKQVLAGEEAPLRRLVLAAVALHNRFAVAAHLPAPLRQVTHAVRDADKCDIMRIMAEELSGSGPLRKTVVLHVQNDPELWSPKVVDDILAGRVAGYPDLRSVNDFRLLLCSWLYDLHFAVSRRCIQQAGYVECLLDNLPAHPRVQAARQKLLDLLAQPQ